MSEILIARIEDLLGHPVRDPHGDPIPPVDGSPQRPNAVQLAAAAPGRQATIIRISDADPDLLRYFSRLGLRPDTQLTVRERRPFAAGTTVRISGQDSDIELGSSAADAIWVAGEPQMR